MEEPLDLNVTFASSGGGGFAKHKDIADPVPIKLPQRVIAGNAALDISQRLRRKNLKVVSQAAILRPNSKANAPVKGQGHPKLIQAPDEAKIGQLSNIEQLDRISTPAARYDRRFKSSAKSRQTLHLGSRGREDLMRRSSVTSPAQGVTQKLNSDMQNVSKKSHKLPQRPVTQQAHIRESRQTSHKLKQNFTMMGQIVTSQNLINLQPMSMDQLARPSTQQSAILPHKVNPKTSQDQDWAIKASSQYNSHANMTREYQTVDTAADSSLHQTAVSRGGKAARHSHQRRSMDLSNPYMDRPSESMTQSLEQVIMRTTMPASRDGRSLSNFKYELAVDPESRRKVVKKSFVRSSTGAMAKVRKSMQLPNRTQVLTNLDKIDKQGNLQERKLLQTYVEDSKMVLVRRQVSKKTRQSVKNILQQREKAQRNNSNGRSESQQTRQKFNGYSTADGTTDIRYAPRVPGLQENADLTPIKSDKRDNLNQSPGLVKYGGSPVDEKRPLEETMYFSAHEQSAQKDQQSKFLVESPSEAGVTKKSKNDQIELIPASMFDATMPPQRSQNGGSKPKRGGSPSTFKTIRSRSPLMARMRSSSPTLNDKSSIDWDKNRPSILDRFQLHSSLMDVQKANEKTKAQITKRELQKEKLMKNLKESQLRLEKLRTDDIMMRQDLATYESNVEDRIDISGKCKTLVMTVETRKKRLDNLVERTEPSLEGFLAGIVDNVDNLSKIAAERQANFSKPIRFQSIEGFQDAPEHDENNLPNELWIERHNVNVRTKTFYDYFIKNTDSQDD